jgi:hypothetical protein
MTRRSAVSITLALGLAAAASPAAGQGLDDGRRPPGWGGRVIVLPRAGLLVPLRPLGLAPAQPDADGVQAAPHRVELGGGGLVGAAALFEVPGSPVLLRVDVAYAPRLGVRVGGKPGTASADALIATAGIGTLPRLEPGLRPYAVAGVGMRAYRFAAGPTLRDGPALPPGRVDPIGRLGAGLALGTGPLVLTAEGEALASTFRFRGTDPAPGGRTLQTDVLATIGLRLKVF